MVELLHAGGGIALLFFGIRFLRKGLNRLFGERLSVWMGRVTDKPLRASVMGMGLGAAAPSSTTLSLMAVNLVGENRVSPPRAMALLLGAYVGMTLTVQLIAFDIASHAPILALMGIIFFQGTKRNMLRGVGQVLLAMSFVFLGVGVVKDSTAGMLASEDMHIQLALLAKYPWLVAMVGIVLTMLTQSSTAAIAIIVGLSVSGDAESAAGATIVLPYIFGANIGVAGTALLAGWSRIESRRFGLGIFLSRSVIAAVLILLMGPIADFFDRTPGSLARQIANAHTAFNLLTLIVCLPWLGIIWKVCSLLVPARIDSESDSFSARFVDTRWADDPSVAFTQTKHEIARMASIVQEMLQQCWIALKTGDPDVIRRVRVADDRVDALDRIVKRFLTQQIAEEISPQQAQARVQQLRFLSDLEIIGDVIDRNLLGVAIKKHKRGVRFSNKGWAELKEYLDVTMTSLELATATFATEQKDIASRLLTHHGAAEQKEVALRDRHFERLRHGESETIDTTEMHLEVLSQLNHINHIAVGVAYGVLEGDEDKRD